MAVLLVMLGLSGLAAAGYLISGTDMKITQNHRASLKAFYAADAGLDHFLGSGKIVADTVTYKLADGTAKVWLDPLIEVDDSTSLFLIHSLGEHGPPEGGAARRHVATVALRRAVRFNVNAAITAASGLQKNGVAGFVSGLDAATLADCTVGGLDDVAGLAVPEDGFDQSGGGKGKDDYNDEIAPSGFFGDPPVLEDGTGLELANGTRVPWQSVLDGTFAEADFVVSQDGYPSFGAEVAADEWPVIYADGSDFAVSPTMSGRGALIVRDDLEINGNFEWEGLILVGGSLTSNGIEYVDGAVITGLNLLLGESVEESNIGNGNWRYQYHSCNVLRALKGLGWPVEEPGTWFEVM